MQSSEFFGKYNPLAMQFVPRFSVIPSFFPGSNIIPANIIIPTGFFDMRSLMALAQNNFAKSHMDVPTSLYSHPSMVSDHSSTNYSFSPSVSSPCEEQSVEFNSLTNNTNDETFLKYEESGDNVKIEELVKEEKSSSFIKQSKKIKKQTFTIIRDAQHSKPFCKESVERKRTSWTKEEDSMLLQLYEQYGSKWSRIAAGIKGRTSKQTRERYLHILSPGINHGKWTKEEKELFVVLYKRLGNKWSEIAKSLPGRTEVMIKNRFYAKKRKGQYQDLVVEAGQVSGI